MIKIYKTTEKENFEKFINMVAETILQNNLSLFIGAGSSIQYGAMNWDNLIDSIFDKCNDWENENKAQYAQLKGINIKEEVSKKISSIKIDNLKKDTYLYYLLNYEYKSIWTTNYDNIIENILYTKSHFFLPVYKYEHFKNLSFPGGLFVYKINGSADAPRTIIITKEDFINYRKSHEAYLILLKRELLCNSFLFLGCSFDDDILRMCIKDILNCIENSTDNYLTNHFAIIVDSNKEKLEFISKDLSSNYNIKCLIVSNYENAYKIAYGISYKVKYSSIFISGAKQFERNSIQEINAKRVCREIISEFMKIDNFPFKFISGMGMSIGHFISGTVKQLVKNRNINRYLQMEPFPFTSKEDNINHRKKIIKKAGIFIFIYGDFDGNLASINKTGMWQEYIEAKKDNRNIIIPLPCGDDSISTQIFKEEKKHLDSFTYKNIELLSKFNFNESNIEFFEELVTITLLNIRRQTDNLLDEILKDLN